MRQNIRILLLSFLLISCMARPADTPVPTLLPTEIVLSATPPQATPVFTQAPIQSATQTPTQVQCEPPDVREYSGQILDEIGTDEESCLPDKSKDDIGVYIFDLTHDQELLSINADTPFQFASAFKGPVLVYFLSTCRQYWDLDSPDWDTYFRDLKIARDPRYATDEYRALISGYISDVNNWKDIEAYFMANRVGEDGAEDVIDKRYFILHKVYSMIARSNNAAAGDVLQFIFDHCLEQDQTALQQQEECSGPNAITAFNSWFYEFTGLKQESGELHNGLYEWDVILSRDSEGHLVETVMPTNGLKDSCTNAATLNCTKGSVAANVFTARELFRFYTTLYWLDGEKVRQIAFDLLRIDEPGPARGNLKNLARNVGAEALSKNGYAFYIYDSIITDAGILRYKGNDYIVVTLSFNARETIATLYGAYDPNGVLIGSPGLIQTLLDNEQGRCPASGITP